ncbi:hypothetical protein ACHAQI_001759 [Fusarium lateritium]
MPTRTEFFGYEFSNLGPLTTTYSPPPSCTTVTTDRIYYGNATSVQWQFGGPTCGPQSIGRCFPSGSEIDKRISVDAKYFGGQGSFDYFSPGVVCPEGWTTAGTLAHGDKSSVQKSGVFTGESFRYPAESYERHFLSPDEIWLEVLESSETLAYCCPSGWTAGIWQRCYSSIMPFTSATYTEVCYNYLPDDARAIAHTIDGTSVTDDMFTILSVTDWTQTTMAFTAQGGPQPRNLADVAIVRNFPAVGLVYKDSDAAKATETSTSGDKSEESQGADENGASTVPKPGSLAPLAAVFVSILFNVGFFVR